MKNKALKFAVLCLLSGVSLFFNTGQVGAYPQPFGLSPNPNGWGNDIPWDAQNALSYCNGDATNTASPAFQQWVSRAGTNQNIRLYSGQSINDAYPTGLDLRLHWASAICYDPPLIDESRLRTEGIELTGGMSGHFTVDGVTMGTGYTKELWLGPHGTSASDNYRHASYDFKLFSNQALYDPGSGSRTVTIRFSNRTINHATSNIWGAAYGRYGCITPPQPSANNGWNYDNCYIDRPSFNLTIEFVPPPAACTFINIPSVVTSGQVFNVTVRLSNQMGATIAPADRYNGYHIGVVNQNGASPPDNPNATGGGAWGVWHDINAVSGLTKYDEGWYGGQYYRRFYLASGIPPGGNTDYTFSATANVGPGSHLLGVRLLNRTTGEWLPANSNCMRNITVAHDDGTCTISAPSEAIINQSFSVTVTARNTGTTTWTSGGNYRLGATSGVNPNWGVSRTNLPTAPPFNNGVPPNSNVPFTFNITAPSTPGTYTFSRRMIKGEAGWFGETCQVNIIIKYATPTAHCRVDDRVEQVIGTPVRRTLYVWYSGANTYPAGSGSQAVATTDLREGTTLMSNFTGRGSQSGRNGTSDADSFVFTYDHTYNNPGVIQTNGRATIRTPDGVGGTRTSATASCSDGTNVGYQPFMKVYGGAVRAGGTFCNETTARADGRYGGVYGFGRSLAPYKGTSSQLTIEALLAVKGAYSASLRGSTPTPLKGLTLANDDAVQSNGGEFAGSHPDCITDYFEQTRDESIQADLSVNPFPPADIPPQPQAPIRQDMFKWYSSSASNPANADFPYCVQWNASTNPGADNRTWNDNWLCSKADLGMVWLSNTTVRPDGGWGSPTGPGSAYRVSIYNTDAYYSGVARTPATGTGWAGRFYVGFTTQPANWARYGFFTDTGSSGALTAQSLGFIESGTVPTNDDRHCVRLSETQDKDAWDNKWWCGPWHYLAQPPLPAVPGVFPSGPHQYVLPAGNVTLDGLSIPRGSQITVYVDGDAYITNNIVYSSDSRSALTDIPRLELYVKGNIYVAPNVTRLDGLYVAQPRNDSKKGIMYTCAGAFTTFTSAQLYTNCGNTPLAINGAVVAKQVRFLRVRSTVEQDVTGWGPGNYADGLGTNAGEVINYTPEMYLAPSASRMPADAGSGITGWQSMQALPPIW